MGKVTKKRIHWTLLSEGKLWRKIIYLFSEYSDEMEVFFLGEGVEYWRVVNNCGMMSEVRTWSEWVDYVWDTATFINEHSEVGVGRGTFGWKYETAGGKELGVNWKNGS